MLALTFFSLLHVPINVPALAQSLGEDNADLNHELKLHGYSNFLSGCAGSIQNYLVYANTVFFFRSGGNSRLAGFMLAGLTAVTMVTGLKLIGYIPIMMVGTLIFVLGFELLSDALIAPRHKLKKLEYLTVGQFSPLLRNPGANHAARSWPSSLPWACTILSSASFSELSSPSSR